MKYKKLFPFTIGGIQYTDEEVQNNEELQMKAVEQYESFNRVYRKTQVEEMKMCSSKEKW